jgi:hypothetical protein
LEVVVIILAQASTGQGQVFAQSGGATPEYDRTWLLTVIP